MIPVLVFSRHQQRHPNGLDILFSPSPATHRQFTQRRRTAQHRHRFVIRKVMILTPARPCSTMVHASAVIRSPRIHVQIHLGNLLQTRRVHERRRRSFSTASTTLAVRIAIAVDPSLMASIAYSTRNTAPRGKTCSPARTRFASDPCPDIDDNDDVKSFASSRGGIRARGRSARAQWRSIARSVGDFMDVGS